ncbi:MAG: XRE family transcriptional regulator [Dechloromonas sp.]|nr:XRE family transcriptional regulator [Dechloromonas sp.]
MRRLLGLSQAALAVRLGVSQPQVAQLENQADMHLVTLRRHVTALGGELELLVRFPDQHIEIILPEGEPTHSLSSANLPQSGRTPC